MNQTMKWINVSFLDEHWYKSMAIPNQQLYNHVILLSDSTGLWRMNPKVIGNLIARRHRDYFFFEVNRGERRVVETNMDWWVLLPVVKDILGEAGYTGTRTQKRLVRALLRIFVNPPTDLPECNWGPLATMTRDELITNILSDLLCNSLIKGDK